MSLVDCNNCAFWDELENVSGKSDDPNAVGYCRRHAPTARTGTKDDCYADGSVGETPAVWPMTNGVYDGCGEGEPLVCVDEPV